MDSKKTLRGFTLVELLITLSVTAIILLIVTLLFIIVINSDRVFNLEHEKIMANYNLMKMLKYFLTSLNTDKISTTTLGDNLVFYYKEVLPSLQINELYHWLYPYEEDGNIDFYSTTTSVESTPSDDINKWIKIVFPMNLDIKMFDATPIDKELRYQAVIGMKNSVGFLDISSATSIIEGVAYPPLR